MRAALAFLWLAAASSPAQAAPAAPVAISDVSIIPIHDGINTVPQFAADGRPATVVRAWRDNGDAHGHYTYLVLLPLIRNEADSRTGVVAFDHWPDPLRAASPFDGERVLETVRFAWARLDGTPAMVVIRADLGEAASGVLADHAPVDISVYRLESPGVDVGTTPDVFHLVSKTRPGGLFCNADMALATVLHLPLPSDYAGGKAPSGCAD